MFSLFKNLGGSTRTSFLDKADDALDEAIRLQNPALFKQFCSPRFFNKLVEIIEEQKDVQRGLKEYRQREWEFVSEDGKSIVAIKTVKHAPLRVTRTLTLPVGENYQEKWKVVVDKEVLDIASYQ